MILVDTSVWVRFLANRQPFARTLDRLLENDDVAGHEFVYGELLVGDRGGRRKLLSGYALMPQLDRLAHEEVVEFARERRLLGLGLGWIDIHLLASAIASNGLLYSADNRLVEVANQLGVAFERA
jgi:predicted nucleic acid-binding protein